MSFAMLSAISLMCVDAAFAAHPLPSVAPAPAPVIEPAAVSVQTQTQSPGGDLTAPPAEDVAPVSATGAALATGDDAAAGPLVFEDESDDAVVARLMNYLQGIDTLQGDFTQIAPSGAISNGRFYLRRPGLLRFEYDPPTPLLVVANGGMVYVRDEALETTDSYPAGKTPLKFLLNKKIDLDDAKVIAVDRGVDSFAVTLASKKEETEGEITMILKAPEMSLSRWIVRDLEGGITVVTLDNVKAGERLANSLFRTPDAGGEFLKN